LPGASQPASTMPQPNQLIEQVLHHTKQRNPEALDKILDNSPVDLNRKLVAATVAALHRDIDTLAWFCGSDCGGN
jgi:hypothetical protein